MGSFVKLQSNGNGNGNGVGDGYLALPEAGNGPGVLVYHAWWGRTQFILDLCDRLAAEGFVALAPDMFGGATAETIEQAEQLAQNSSFDATHRVSNAAVNTLRAHPAVTGEGVAVLGFSFGAAYALLISGERTDDIRKTVIFYGTYSDVDVSNARSSYLGHFAANDPFEPASEVEAMETTLRSAGHTTTFYTYPDTGHWFFENDQPNAFDPLAAQLAWERTLAYLRT